METGSLAKSLLFSDFLMTFPPKIELRSQVSNILSRERDFGLECRPMNLDGKEINYIFIFHSSPTIYFFQYILSIYTFNILSIYTFFQL